MKINTINWHKDNLKNSRIYADNLGDDLRRLKEKINKVNKENSFYCFQIRCAEKLNKPTFNIERFKKKQSIQFFNGEKVE